MMAWKYLSPFEILYNVAKCSFKEFTDGKVASNNVKNLFKQTYRKIYSSCNQILDGDAGFKIRIDSQPYISTFKLLH